MPYASCWMRDVASTNTQKKERVCCASLAQLVTMSSHRCVKFLLLIIGSPATSFCVFPRIANDYSRYGSSIIFIIYDES